MMHPMDLHKPTSGLMVANAPILIADAAVIKDETMLFSADPEFAFAKGGPITRKAIEFLISNLGMPDDNVVIDTRVHMLKPGWNPAIPGWHCDAVPRGADGQPDFSDPSLDDIEHYLLVIDADDQPTGAMTEFVDLKSPVRFPAPDAGENVWGVHSRIINELLDAEARHLEVLTLESGRLYRFTAHDYHRSVPATGSGWRYFLRASVNTKTRGPFNEIRQQVQVYMPDADLGW